MNDITIREAIASDAEQIVFVQTESWKSTYRGIFPDQWLDKNPETIARNIEGRRKQIIENTINGWPNFVAEIDGKIVGWLAGGINTNQDYKFEADLGAIYLLKEFQKQGIGKLLVKEFSNLVIKNGFSSMIIWVLENNYNARRFYENLGGKVVGKMMFKEIYTEIGYGYNLK